MAGGVSVRDVDVSSGPFQELPTSVARTVKIPLTTIEYES